MKQRPSKKIVAQPVRQLARRSASRIPVGYPALLKDIKARIRTAQIKASLSVNRELIELYWSIGRDIVARQHLEGWGAGVINRLARDIRTAFPGIEGFSPSNISRMRAFHRAWADVPAISAQPVPNMHPPISAQPVPKMTGSLPPSVLMEIPWGRGVALRDRLAATRRRARPAALSAGETSDGVSTSMGPASLRGAATPRGIIRGHEIDSLRGHSFLHQPGAKMLPVLTPSILQQPVGEITEADVSILQQPVAELEGASILPQRGTR